MKLLIVESPSKARTIEKYLEGAFTVRASVGHIRDLPKSNKEAIDIEGGFIPYYEISKGKERVVHELQSLAEKASEILLATDPDREGEAIAWHIEELLKADKKIKASTKRVVFYEITKEAIQKALKNPRNIDTALRKAQEARRVLDRLVGYDLSGLIWKKVRYGLSAGRVQSPALRIIMEREREIRAFIPEAYWTLTAKVKTQGNAELELSCTEEPRDELIVKNILKVGRANQWVVREVKESEVSRTPKAPFITSTLQQAGSSRFGFAPSRTMGIAQKLYEKGFITYMRTDSTVLSLDAQKAAIAEITKRYGAASAEARVFKTKSKNAQEAHEAIRPTDMSKDNLGINPEEQKLYKLIWARTIASQMIDAKLARTTILANVRENLIPNFSVTGSRVILPGWLAADPDSRGENVGLPKVSQGEPLILLSLTDEAKFTEPPSRYSEAGLVKELEKRDIGRPSTYASIIKTIIDRGYVEKEQRSLRPTDTGDVVSTFLEKNFANYISDTFTAEMENKLDDIANGERDYVKTLKEFYGPFTKEVKAKDKLDKITTLGDADPQHKCPKCNSDMVIKLAKNGKFYSCSKFPDCAGARTIEGEVLEGPKETGEPCPKCKDGKLIERDGRYGRFITCNRYPKCKYIKKDDSANGAGGAGDTGVTCNLCKAGTMVEKRGRFGIFYGCSNYPDCKNIIKTKPTGNICPLCQSLMMQGTKTIPERCSNRMCRNHNPHKLGDNIKSNKK